MFHVDALRAEHLRFPVEETGHNLGNAHAGGGGMNAMQQSAIGADANIKRRGQCVHFPLMLEVQHCRRIGHRLAQVIQLEKAMEASLIMLCIL
jgi:hypothetical protein